MIAINDSNEATDGLHETLVQSDDAQVPSSTAPLDMAHTAPAINPARFRFVHPLTGFLILFGMVNLTFGAFLDASPVSWLQWIYDLQYTIFRIRAVVVAVWAVAVLLHVGETVWIGCMMDRKNIRGVNVALWLAQTLLFGWPSTMMVLAMPDHCRRGQ